MNVLLIYGGASPEHEVSIRSAKTVWKGLKAASHAVRLAYVTKDGEWKLRANVDDTAEKPLSHSSGHWVADGQPLQIDVAFPLIHGLTGEDGQLQAHLEQMHTPYVGCSADVSRLCFDKYQTKRKLAAAGIKVSPEVVVRKADRLPDYAVLREELGDTLFVKPARSGSSIGVHKVEHETELADALQDAFLYDDVSLIERAVPKPRELEVAVLETSEGVLEASGVGEIIPGESFYSYDDKYAAASTAKTDVGPKLEPALAEQVRQAALQTAKVLGCQGMVRVDFLYATAEEELYVNEVNTLPGFTSISMYPKLWEASGMMLPQLCDRLVRIAAATAW